MRDGPATALWARHRRVNFRRRPLDYGGQDGGLADRGGEGWGKTNDEEGTRNRRSPKERKHSEIPAKGGQASVALGRTTFQGTAAGSGLEVDVGGLECLAKIRVREFPRAAVPGG